MKTEREDRRVRITKMAIRESLIELMQQQPIAKISVKMICEAADINRSTFYAHYQDQYDLLDKIQREAAAGIREYISYTQFTDNDEGAVSVVVQVLEYARANAALFKVLLSEHGDSTFQSEIMHLVQQKTMEELYGDKQVLPAVTKYIELFAINGILSIIHYWLENGCVDSPEALAQLILKLLMEGIRSFY
ncbi:TetR/AcrR family transcriptional regulator [Clostridia bacterium OttesenSCG-928-O13]|nr:TetR/AcrR family transcriptional regulator [Clostridia bacterium OttesenSCG-928-O13]